MVSFAGKVYVYQMHRAGSYLQWVMAEFQEGLVGWGTQIQKLQKRYASILERLNLSAVHLPPCKRQMVWKTRFPGSDGCRSKATSKSRVHPDLANHIEERTCSTHLLIGLLLQTQSNSLKRQSKKGSKPDTKKKKSDTALSLLHAIFNKFFSTCSWTLTVVLDITFQSSTVPGETIMSDHGVSSTTKASTTSIVVANGMVNPSAHLNEVRTHCNTKAHKWFNYGEMLLEEWMIHLWDTPDPHSSDWLLRQLLHSAALEVEKGWAAHGFSGDALKADLTIRQCKKRVRRLDPHLLQQFAQEFQGKARQANRWKQSIMNRRKGQCSITPMVMDKAVDQLMYGYMYKTRGILCKCPLLALSFDACRALTLVHFSVACQSHAS